MRRAFAGKQELTPPPAVPFNAPILTPVRLMGHTRFWLKETNFTSFMPKGHAAAPKAGEQRKTLCNKKPGKCRAFQFSVTS
jgi:hypothetical protein